MNNNYRIVYEQAYTPYLDITIIMKYIYKGKKTIFQTISGFYYGTPSLENMEKFKDKNFIKGDE